MKDKYQSELLEAIHETAEGLYKIGVIDDKEMKEYDKDCLTQASKINENESCVEVDRSNPVTA